MKPANLNTVLLIICLPLLGYLCNMVHGIDNRLSRVEQQLIDRVAVNIHK